MREWYVQPDENSRLCNPEDVDYGWYGEHGKCADTEAATRQWMHWKYGTLIGWDVVRLVDGEITERR